MKQKKYIYEKRILRKFNVEFSILHPIIFYSGSIKNQLSKIENISFSNNENEKI